MSLILDLIFPKFCYGCKKSNYYICPDCLDKLETKPIKVGINNTFEGVVSVFKYSSFIKSLIHDLKYNFVSDVCDEITQACVQKIKTNYPHVLQYWQQNKFCIIPIPLHPFRQNWRGFNQSALLAQKIAMSLNLDFSENLLTRNINTKSQVKLKYKRQRFSNLSSVFTLNTNSKVPENIILFDDVITTGSTLNSALKTLKTLLASRYWSLTLAG